MKSAYTWTDFQTEWQPQFEKTRSALKLIHLYPERLPLVYLGNLLTSEDLEASQRDWIRLRNKFHEVEKVYFQPSFVPINCDSFDHFIDLSKEELPIYNPIFNSFKKSWFHLTRFEKMIDLIDYLESDTTKPPVRDKDLAANIDAKIKEYGLDDLLGYLNLNDDE